MTKYEAIEAVVELVEKYLEIDHTEYTDSDRKFIMNLLDDIHRIIEP